MSNVNLTIGGRVFTVAATDGEESHIAMLGHMIDERAGRLIAGPGQSETRMLLFAALLLADELHDAHRKEPPPPPEVPLTEPEEAGRPGAEIAAEVAARIEALASRVEKLAAYLEEPGP
jgi:cell division protein ZapA